MVALPPSHSAAHAKKTFLRHQNEPSPNSLTAIPQTLCWELMEHILTLGASSIIRGQHEETGTQADFIGDRHLKRVHFLNNCSLVCSPWTTPSQSLLCAEVRLETKLTSKNPAIVIKDFVEGGVASNNFATRSFDLRGNGYDALEGLQATELLEKCRGIRSLRLFRVNNVIALLQSLALRGSFSRQSRWQNRRWQILMNLTNLQI